MRCASRQQPNQLPVVYEGYRRIVKIQYRRSTFISGWAEGCAASLGPPYASRVGGLRSARNARGAGPGPAAGDSDSAHGLNRRIDRGPAALPDGMGLCLVKIHNSWKTFHGHGPPAQRGEEHSSGNFILNFIINQRNREPLAVSVLPPVPTRLASRVPP